MRSVGLLLAPDLLEPVGLGGGRGCIQQRLSSRLEVGQLGLKGLKLGGAEGGIREELLKGSPTRKLVGGGESRNEIDIQYLAFRGPSCPYSPLDESN